MKDKLTVSLHLIINFLSIFQEVFQEAALRRRSMNLRCGGTFQGLVPIVSIVNIHLAMQSVLVERAF